MAKNYNPADAFRKAQRAKELKKNKETRKKVREVQTVKRDTRDLESEIRSLRDKKDNASKSRIAELESELAYVQKTKEAYVKEHPDAKDKIFKPRNQYSGAGGRGGGDEDDDEEDEGEGDENGASGSRATLKRGRLYDEDGKLRDPTRSAYYDPVYNPWGAPPPGMPYKERSGLESEVADEDEKEEDEEDDDEIVMPSGPPPGDDDDGDEDEDDDDDIPLPAGPPPPRAAPPIPPSGPSGWGGRAPPIPIPFHQQPPPPIHMGGRQGMPPSFPMGMPFQQQQQQQQQPPMGGPSRLFRPPRQYQAPQQDPLSDEPTHTYQSYHASLPARPPPSSSLPGAPTPPGLPGSTNLPVRPPPPTAATSEISAAPQLRDLRKEATVFVPRNLKRKAGSGVGGRINAAPGGGVKDDEGDEVVVRKMNSGLMGKLKGVLGPEMGAGQAGKGVGRQGATDEDYERFLAGLGDIS